MAVFVLATLSCGKDEVPPPAPSPGTTLDEAALRQEMREEMQTIAREEVARALTGRGRAPHERPTPATPPTPTRPTPLSPVPSPPVPAEPDVTSASTEPDVGTLATPPTPDDATLVVTDLRTATGINRAERLPEGVTNDFEVTGGVVWAYAVLRNDSERERKVTFVWTQDGEERGRSELNVGAKAARWRTWSRKRLTPQSPGRWTIEVRDESDLPIASRTFEVRN